MLTCASNHRAWSELASQPDTLSLEEHSPPALLCPLHQEPSAHRECGSREITLKCTHVYTLTHTHTGTHSSVHLSTHTQRGTPRESKARPFIPPTCRSIKTQFFFTTPFGFLMKIFFNRKVKMYPFFKSAFSEVQLLVDFNPWVLQK